MTRIEIRAARESDLEALLVLFGQLADAPIETASDAARTSLAAMIEAPWIHLLVAEVEGVLAGTVELVVVPNVAHSGRPWAQLENMVVDAQFRGMGVGQSLLQRCSEIAKEFGCYKIQLQSANHRSGAHRFYEAAGYVASAKGYRLYF